MNIQKTNKLGLLIAKEGFIGTSKRIEAINKKDSTDTITVNPNLMRHNPNSKIIRVSKGIIDACKMIDIDTIKENINELNFDFRSMLILLDSDKSGVIKAERMGGDISFILMSNLDSFNANFETTYNSYSFLTKSFSIEKEEITSHNKLSRFGSLFNYEKSVFVIQLLTYLIFGEITEKHIPQKTHVNIGFTRFLNNSNINISFCDTLWRQRISTDGFKVRGHFRLQPIGECRLKRKLIWIEEFQKSGYNRKATVELINS